MSNRTLDLQPHLTAAFLRAAERLAFMFGEPLAKEELDLDGQRLTRAEMSFAGDAEGTLCVAVPPEAATEIAANILGLEREDKQSREMAEDALGEMLSVVCGLVVADLGGQEADFILHPPRISVLSTAAQEQMMLDEDFLGFSLDGHPAFFGLHLEEG